MTGFPTRHDELRHLATAALVVVAVATVATAAYGCYEWSAAGNRAAGIGFVAGSIAGLLIGVLLYCQVLLVHKLVNYSYRNYDTLLETAELLRRQEEHGRTIAENSSQSEWAKRVVYREKDYEFLRDTIQSAVVRQDWEAAQHLIRDMEKEFGYHDEAAHLREELELARRSTTEERIAAALARFDLLSGQQKWQQALVECERLRVLFPGENRIANLPRELERRRQDHKQELLHEYEQAVRSQDVEKAHRLLFALDQYLLPKEAEPLKESARGVFRARLEQLKAQFTIAISYKQYPGAIAAGEKLIQEFPNSGYAHEIAKLLPMLRQRAGQQVEHAGAGTSPTAS
jgi:hypothetical protein